MAFNAYSATPQQMADEFAEKGTVKHFAMRQGFMPHNEEDAEAILLRYIADLEKEIRDLKRAQKST